MYNDPNQNNPYQQPNQSPFNPQQPQSNPNQPPYQPPFNPQGPQGYQPQPVFTPPPLVPPKKNHTKRNIGCLILILALVVCGAVSVANSANGGKNVTAQTTTTVATTTTSQQSTQAKATTPLKPTATPKPKPSFATFGDGTFQVGKDIQPGTYRTRDGSDNCYYERLKGFTGALDDIIANNNTSDPAVVTIDAGDKGFQSTGCSTWTKDLSPITKSKASFGDGMYIVGTDIEPGTYKSSGQSGCYYARLSGFGNTNDDILANDNTDASAIVTIVDGDKGFQSTRCGTWTKM